MKRLYYVKRILLFVALRVTMNLPLINADAWQLKSSNREKKNFNANWLFYRGEIADDAAKSLSFDDKNWQAVHLPHSPKITQLRHPWRLPDSQGINWYRKRFQLPETYKGRKIFIEFEGADQVAEVWINGTHLVTHIGAYLPFTVDVTDYAKVGNQAN